MKISGKYFCGNEISEYGQQNGYLDYRTLAKAFDCVLNNEIINFDVDNWDLISGDYYDEETDEYNEIFQYYIVSDNGAEILQEINEIVFYNSNLDMYVWGVTHWGTPWDYVLTNVKCNCGYDETEDC